MRQVSFYDQVSGMLSSTFITTSDDSLVALNTPAGELALDGQYDHATQRFDIPSGAIVQRGACPVSAAVAARVVTLSGVPSVAAYTVSGDASATGTGDSTGTLALTFGAPGTYLVAIPCFPLLDYLGSFTLP